MFCLFHFLSHPTDSELKYTFTSVYVKDVLRAEYLGNTVDRVNGKLNSDSIEYSVKYKKKGVNDVTLVVIPLKEKNGEEVT